MYQDDQSLEDKEEVYQDDQSLEDKEEVYQDDQSFFQENQEEVCKSDIKEIVQKRSEQKTVVKDVVHSTHLFTKNAVKKLVKRSVHKKYHQQNKIGARKVTRKPFHSSGKSSCKVKRMKLKQSVTLCDW